MKSNMTSNPVELPPIKWWVVFTKATVHRRWFYHLIPSYKPPFQHCYAICEIASGILVKVDPQMNIMSIGMFQGSPYHHLRVEMKAGARVLFVAMPVNEKGLQANQDTDRRFKLGFAITCASVISYCLGLDSHAVTPHQLWQVLVKSYGATEVEYHVRTRRRRQRPTGRSSGGDAGSGAGGAQAA